MNAFAALACGTAALAGGFELDWHTIDGGGGTSSGAGFTLSGTIGQPDAGVMTGGNFTLVGGFWAGVGVGSGGDLIGDMNCNGVVNVSDIGAFVLALTDPAAYAAQFPGCNILNGDCNNNGEVSVADIGCFVAILTGG